jgi:DNA mismatch repair protein MSH6
MDAVICVENLNLTYMKGKYAHCGFPEMAYGRFADQLVSLGYKVARVEQTETPNQADERAKKERLATKDKVVRRELCRITTAATRTLDVYTPDSATDSPDANYLLSICERKSLEDGPTITRFGVCFVDCSVGHFYVSLPRGSFIHFLVV